MFFVAVIIFATINTTSLFVMPLKSHNILRLSPVCAGQDRSLRMWERGEDLVFVEEEK